jgi:hypothetical protein
MSEWNLADANDVELSKDGKTVDVYVKQDDWGSVYVMIPVKHLKKILKEIHD